MTGENVVGLNVFLEDMRIACSAKSFGHGPIVAPVRVSAFENEYWSGSQKVPVIDVIPLGHVLFCLCHQAFGSRSRQTGRRALERIKFVREVCVGGDSAKVPCGDHNDRGHAGVVGRGVGTQKSTHAMPDEHDPAGVHSVFLHIG